MLARLAPVASCDAAMSDDLIGQATVVDGDNPKSTATAFAFWGIDAPESTQFCSGEDSDQYRCGAQAANDLDGFIAAAC